jgi:hypothetical protein
MTSDCFTERSNGVASAASDEAESSWERRVKARAEILRQQRHRSDLAKAKGASDWLWEGYLARGKSTLFISQWKTGKTTLISILAALMEKGGELAGLAVAPGRVAIITEEGEDNWDQRCEKLNMGNHVSFSCRPFRTQPTMEEWQGMIDALLEIQRTEGLDLVVIDPLVYSLPGNIENSAAGITNCLRPLGELMARGISVLIAHHPAKGATRPGQAARGSGALSSFVDIILEMSWCGSPEDEADRRRWLHAYSRHAETRKHLVLELTPDGTNYVARDREDEDGQPDLRAVLQLVLEEAFEPMTQAQIMEEWPEDFEKPQRTKLWRALQQGVGNKEILTRGTGRRGDPLTYWIASRQDLFSPGPAASEEELERFHRAHEALAMTFLPRMEARWKLPRTVTTPVPPPQQSPGASPPANEAAAAPVHAGKLEAVESKAKPAPKAKRCPVRSAAGSTAAKASTDSPPPAESQAVHTASAAGAEVPPQEPVAPAPAPAVPSAPMTPFGVPLAPIAEACTELTPEQERRKYRRWPHG